MQFHYSSINIIDESFSLSSIESRFSIKFIETSEDNFLELTNNLHDHAHHCYVLRISILTNYGLSHIIGSSYERC